MNAHDRRVPICFLTNAYPDKASPYPTYGRFIRELAQHLTRYGLTISVVTPRLFQHSRSHEQHRYERVDRFPFWSDNRLLIEHRRVPILRMVTYLISGLVTGLRVVRRDSCRLIHAHWGLPAGLIAVVIGRLVNRPVVLTIHGSDVRWAFEKKGLFRVLFRWTARRADCVTTVSRNIAEKTRTLGISEAKIRVFPMGVSDEFFAALPDGLSRSEGDGKTIIVSNRHLLPVYNVDCLVRAIPHVVEDTDQVLFLIAGDGERRRALESMVHRTGLAPWVRFLGTVDHEQMPGVLKASQIYVSTSLSDGASVSLLEAMVCGLFPIVTDIPANREWIRHGDNGFLVTPDDEFALADKIKLALKDETMRKRAGRVNMSLAREGASWGKVCTILREVYQSVAVL